MSRPPEAVFSPDRFLDALVGGGAALLVSLLLPVNPERLVGQAVAPVLFPRDAQTRGAGNIVAAMHEHEARRLVGLTGAGCATRRSRRRANTKKGRDPEGPRPGRAP